MLWGILICLNCNIDEARAAGWRAEIALVDVGTTSWRRADERTFTSQRECLRAIRRELRESDIGPPDAYGQISKVTHGPDYVEEFQSIPYHMNTMVYRACFALPAETSSLS